MRRALGNPATITNADHALIPIAQYDVFRQIETATKANNVRAGNELEDAIYGRGGFDIIRDFENARR